ncbi:MAG: hypothetical protein RJA99_3165 [Pseudomonadota bacterium]|jgi:hypothetical protein
MTDDTFELIRRIRTPTDLLMHETSLVALLSSDRTGVLQAIKEVRNDPSEQWEGRAILSLIEALINAYELGDDAWFAFLNLTGNSSNIAPRLVVHEIGIAMDPVRSINLMRDRDPDGLAASIDQCQSLISKALFRSVFPDDFFHLSRQFLVER